MTDKLQMMLINVLLYQFSNVKVSQGSVSITAESESEKNENRLTFADVMGN